MMTGVADERGAIVAMVAVMLVAIIGMAALVIDVGGALVTKRQLVAAADSASLAAAQSCAKEEADFASKAAQYAAQNLAGATGTVTPIGCTPYQTGGTVAVTYNANQDLYFAPFLPGVDDVVSVDASATATWGPALTAEPIPVALNLVDHPRACTVVCAFWLDSSGYADFSGGEAGLVDLDRWEGSGCRRNVGRLEGWISGVRTVEVSLPATPCGPTLRGASDGLLEALRGQIGQDRLFPVADGFFGSTFSVRGFAPLRIVDALPVTSGASNEACSDQPEDHDFAGPNDTHSINGEVLACSLANGADAISVQLSKGTGCCSPGDYSFASATNVITWKTEETKNVRIRIFWSKAADSGGCGDREVIGNEICLMVSWQGPRVGSKLAEGGSAEDYGFRAVRLKD
jgi:hypothetical protein